MGPVQQQDAGEAPPPFRVDVTVHELLMNKTRSRPSLLPTGPPQTLPDPIFPRRPTLLRDDHADVPENLREDHFKHLYGNPTFITPADHAQVDDLIDWLCEKQRAGYRMANSVQRLQEMKAHMRGELQQWNCRAGQNTLIVRVDGTLAPCFPMYSATYDWGTVEHPAFDLRQLTEMKKSCQPRCFSTLNHIVGYCYNDARVMKWLARQAVRGFQGVTGTFE